jgi:hypothetical protein
VSSLPPNWFLENVEVDIDAGRKGGKLLAKTSQIKP